MTEEEMKEFQEFLEWKKKHAQSVNEKEHQTQNEIEGKAGKKIQTPKAENTAFPKSGNTVSPKDKEIVSGSISFDTKVSIGIVVALLVILFIVFAANRNSSHNKIGGEIVQVTAVDSITLKKEQAKKDSIAKVHKIEKTRKDSIAKVQRIKVLKNSIRIKSAYLSSPNSASGVDAIFYYTNKSSKTIKYLIWHGYPKNAVGDAVTCDIRGYSEFNGKDTGPVKPGRTSGGCWDCAWYNWEAKRLVLTGIDIEYMDGSSLTINQNELQYVRK